jgi:hypothetical protein
MGCNGRETNNKHKQEKALFVEEIFLLFLNVQLAIMMLTQDQRSVFHRLVSYHLKLTFLERH